MKVGITIPRPFLSHISPQGKIPEYHTVTGEGWLDYGTQFIVLLYY